MTDKVQWKTLPTKANREMEQAGADAAREYQERTGSNNLWVIYEAMAAAAPKPPASTEPVAVLYANGMVLTKADCGDVFDICCKVETPLYTHAGPGEVERLREVIKHSDAQIMRQSMRISNQRAQLAEQDALLEQMLERLNKAQIFGWDKKMAALSACAELSARSVTQPNVDCAICRDLGDQCMECEEAEFREWAERHFAKADYRKTDSGVFIQDWMRHSYSAWQARGALKKTLTERHVL